MNSVKVRLQFQESILIEHNLPKIIIMLIAQLYVQS